MPATQPETPQAKEHQTVGVIGGLGPEATLDFFARVLKRTKAEKDQDHLHLIINNNPKVPNRNEALAGRGPSAGPALVETAVALERAGADCLVMICNTAHAYQDAIKEAVGIPFISMIDEVAKRTQQLSASKAGLLAADGCLEAGLYQNAFESYDVETVSLDDTKQAELMQLIYKVKAGHKDAQPMRELASVLVAQGADCLIAACTEVPLVLAQEDFTVPFIDSTEVLIDALFDYLEID